MHVTQNIHSLHCCFTGRLQKEQSFFREIHTERTEVINVIQISSIYRYCSSSKPSTKNSAPPLQTYSFLFQLRAYFTLKILLPIYIVALSPSYSPDKKKIKKINQYHSTICILVTHRLRGRAKEIRRENTNP